MPQRILLMLGLAAGLCLGQSESIDRTGGFYNGHTWNKLSLLAKAMYLAGLDEGEIRGTVANDRRAPEGFLKADYAKEMDDFYKEPANVRIPMVFAYEYCIEKFKGTPEAELTRMVLGYRRWAASAK